MGITLHNTLTKEKGEFTPLNPNLVTMYSCGPTVYDNVHIGNLSAFIVADILRRVITSNNYTVKHVMNFTDVDDKTIRRSHEKYPNMDVMDALRKLTTEYGESFVEDMKKIGNDVGVLTFIKAADDATISGMQDLIRELHSKGFAYIADDGVYFNIDAYKKSGKKYGQLVEITESNTSNERIQNDEYDKDSIHDFALWKIKKPGEPSWKFELDGHDLTGRPGWHIECSVMSHMELGRPFDIHTGGIDLAFPHHENEIAQSTAGHDDPTYSQTFVHNEHILVDGKKMSKSANNFYTLSNLIDKGVDPLAFRLLVLQSHYRSQTNFSFENATAAHNRLHHWRNIAVLRHQTHETLDEAKSNPSLAVIGAVKEALNDDMNTPEALRLIDAVFAQLDAHSLAKINRSALLQLLESIDEILGLRLLETTPDITDDQKQLILERERAREEKDWAKSDKIRDNLLIENIVLRDTQSGTIWERE
ncbi:MAG: cysteine--tRNA ligase [Candidatus Saccharimonadales bacterium]